MKVLFVYSGYENLGVEMLSAVLRRAGHQTALAFDPRLFDDHYTRIPALARHLDGRPAVLRRARQEAPDLLAFSVVTEDYVWACQVARQLKRQLGLPVVFGGVHVTSVPAVVMENPFVDYAIVGEGEQALLELVRCLEQGVAPDRVPNLWYRRGARVQHNPVAPLIEDLDSLPLPDKQLFYEQLPYLRSDYLTMTSRGCPHRCSYCYNGHMQELYRGKGRYLRRRSVEGVLHELRQARARYPLRRIQFYDDVFTTDRGWLERFAGPYAEQIGLPFWCSVNPAFVDRQVAQLLALMGCWEVQMGVQTVDRRLRREVLRRPESLEQIRRAVALLGEQKIKVVVDNISGTPGETAETLEASLRFYSQLRPARISDYHLRYYPATEMMQIAQQQGLVDEQRLAQLERGEGSESFALGGSQQPRHRRLRSLLHLVPLLPERLMQQLLRRKLYRYLPQNDLLMKVLLRLVEMLRGRDINAERYGGKYRHFLLLVTRGVWP